jgi:hypothetical protein
MHKPLKILVSLICIVFEEVLTAVNIKMKFIWDVTASNFLDKYERFGRNF